MAEALNVTGKHPGKAYIDLPLDYFTVHGPNGDHLCVVHEPLANTLRELLDEAFDVRIDDGSPVASSDDPWSAVFAKTACWQMLQALDFMHQNRIAHRDIRPTNSCFALTGDLNALDENEIQRDVWPEEERPKKQSETETFQDASQEDDIASPEPESSDEDESSEEEEESEEDSSSDDEPPSQRVLDVRECNRRLKEQWETVERGDPTAEPLSNEWNKANFYQSKRDIELAQRRDGKPLEQGEIRYTVRATPLPMGVELSQVSQPDMPFRLVLTDMGFACPFEECEQRPGPTLPDNLSPEDLMRKPATYKADIFAVGLWCWEVVMLRGLIEPLIESDDPDRVRTRNRMLHFLAKRIGPVPASVRQKWSAADEWVDAEGKPLDRYEQEKEDYGNNDYPWGDIWAQARQRKPKDMSDDDMNMFVRFILRMTQWEPEKRATTSELLQDEWFHDMKSF